MTKKEEILKTTKNEIDRLGSLTEKLGKKEAELNNKAKKNKEELEKFQKEREEIEKIKTEIPHYEKKRLRTGSSS